MKKISIIALACSAILAAAPAFTAPLTYNIDAKHTMVLARWSHFGFSNPMANFGEVQGTIMYDAKQPGASSVQVTLPLSGLNSLVPGFDEHLRGEDFFDAAKFPTAQFRSTKVKPLGKNRFQITGDLTIKGITRAVVLDARLNKRGLQPMAKREAIGFDASATIQRSDFGLGKYVPNVGDTVTLLITTEAIVPKPEG